MIQTDKVEGTGRLLVVGVGPKKPIQDQAYLPATVEDIVMRHTTDRDVCPILPKQQLKSSTISILVKQMQGFIQDS